MTEIYRVSRIDGKKCTLPAATGESHFSACEKVLSECSDHTVIETVSESGRRWYWKAAAFYVPGALLWPVPITRQEARDILNLRKQNRFRCVDCSEIKPVNGQGGTGYAITKSGYVCYACCAVRDRERMETESRMTLYLTNRKSDAKRWPEYQVGNWAGTLAIPVSEFRHGRHNMAGSRVDVWFRDHTGREWHGVQYGDNTQIVHCRKLKREAGA